MIAQAFAARRAEGRAALVPYVTAGYPDRGSTVEVLEALADAGADVIELGVPFSDPLADGPTIQTSSFVSLGNGTTVAGVLEDLTAFRARRDTPVVLFTYLNPVIRYGPTAFLEDAVKAGAQGLLLTDLPTGADPVLEAEVIASPLDLVRLVAPTTPLSRVPAVAAGGSGFLYYISRTGVTGARTELRGELSKEVRAIRKAQDLPVAVGFGISSPEQAAFVASLADGVVVGSALVRILGESGVQAGADFVASLREAMDA
ncbi:MAG: tryptophan synthase subunit alpha [Gemmatimonadota bacterium]|nr:tryptophan synthase subunit alpha [Gemmatimonadota bacterium]MDH3421434.1 tryptophan synthase subunit alpha [Gemmatimonadota bacterium]